MSEYKIDIWPKGSYKYTPKVQGQRAHAESYPSSGARNSMGGPQTQGETCIESRPWQ